MIVQRGMLGPQERLRHAIELIGEGRSVSGSRTVQVQIPRGTRLEDLSWLFEDGVNKPILECSKEELIMVLKGFVSAILQRDYPDESSISH